MHIYIYMYIYIGYMQTCMYICFIVVYSNCPAENLSMAIQMVLTDWDGARVGVGQDNSSCWVYGKLW